MRILHLDAGKEMGGGQWQVLRLIEGLKAAGVESTLLARAGAPLFEAARGKGWRVEPIGFTRTAMRRSTHDLVHAHDARSHTVAAVVGAEPLVVSRRVAFRPRGAGHRPAPDWKYSRATRYIAVSDFVKSVLIERGVPAEKISVVYDGVPLLPEAGQVDALPHVLTAKETPLAAEAARLARVPLMLSTNLERDLPAAPLFLYITDCEGLGSAALLAMSAGIPVIASRIGGLPEIVRHGQTGLLVQNDPAAVAGALRELLDDPARARRMGAAARRAVQENFTVDHMLRRTMEVYRQVLA